MRFTGGQFMEPKFKLAIVLVVCGTICILASLGIPAYLYQLNSVALNTWDASHNGPPLMFIFFVGAPSVATFVAGIIMTKVGIRSGLGG
jgi:hypothetical protein